MGVHQSLNKSALRQTLLLVSIRKSDQILQFTTVLGFRRHLLEDIFLLLNSLYVFFFFQGRAIYSSFQPHLNVPAPAVWTPRSCTSGLRGNSLVVQTPACPSVKEPLPSENKAAQTAETTYPSPLSLGLQKKGERQLVKRGYRAQTKLRLQIWAFVWVCLLLPEFT